MLAPSTYFAPAERASKGCVAEAHRRLLAEPLIKSLIDCVPTPVMVLNAERQAVLANHRMVCLLGCGSDDLLGQRPGEALGCIHASEGPDGLGGSPLCRGF